MHTLKEMNEKSMQEAMQDVMSNKTESGDAEMLTLIKG